MKIFHTPFAFEWDRGNREKNFLKHRVTDTECEEIFFDHQKRILKDALHSGAERRYILIGMTKRRRKESHLYEKEA